jgi:hypothetical protein
MFADLSDLCLKDAEELREIAAQFDALGKKLNGDFLREVANRHEILAGAYRTSVARYERELKEWIDRSPTAEEKAAALKWLEDMRGDSECRAIEGEQQ